MTMFDDANEINNPPTNQIADLRAYTIAVALGEECWGMIDNGSLTEWPHLADELKEYMGHAWAHLNGGLKQDIAKAGFPRKMSKLDKKKYWQAINEFRIITAQGWIDRWLSAGHLIVPKRKVHKSVEKWPDDFPRWPSAISAKLSMNKKLRPYFSKEIRKLLPGGS